MISVTGVECPQERGANPHEESKILSIHTGQQVDILTDTAVWIQLLQFNKTARTKTHRSYFTAENKPELKVKDLKKGRQSTHTSKSGVPIINNMV